MARLALVALLAASLCGCDGDLVNLGASPLAAGGGGGAAGASGAGSISGASSEGWLPPVLVFPQEDGVNFSNPTLVHDESLLYYTEQLGSDDPPTAIYRRRLTGGAWIERTQIAVGGSVALDASSPAISPDGSQLWFGQNVPEGTGKNDVWVSTWGGDAWGSPEQVTSLNSALDDAPRPIGGAGVLMPLSSRRHGHERWQIYLATRSSPTATSWQVADRALLGPVNAEPFASSGGFISNDGLTLYFASTRRTGIDTDLFVSRRTSMDEAFGEPTPLQGVNTPANETTPWVSPLGDRLYFASNRSTADYEGQYAIYLSERAP